ncbi:RNA polymerase sigma factor CnrH [Planctomycetes bacterium Poly30]|uniref:RNA polymerase sigma factor CnrH n=1 Tax=Saltatorellus ferox TaxID=2528018 RepID=A0A518EVC7_9BACT|nr:RNA polymerase sigma factor CnrH [Planctomycetes bacterium Poly30]
MADAPLNSLQGLTQHYVLAAKGGDAAEFARLYEHIAPAVYTWANLRLRPEQKAVLDPTDLVQEVWLRAWRKIEAFDADRIPFRFWIFRIAKNVALEASRQARKPDRGQPSSGELDPLDAVADTITGVSARVARDESLARFQAAVEALPDGERKLVLHCGLEGLPLREVGDRLGISEEAAGKRWQRLRQKLQTTDLPAFLLDL